MRYARATCGIRERDRRSGPGASLESGEMGDTDHGGKLGLKGEPKAIGHTARHFHKFTARGRCRVVRLLRRIAGTVRSAVVNSAQRSLLPLAEGEESGGGGVWLRDQEASKEE